MLKLSMSKIILMTVVLSIISYVGWLKYDLLSLESVVNGLKSRVAVKTVEVEQLKANIYIQNQAVEQWKSSSLAKEKQKQSLLMKLKLATRESEKTIAELNIADPQSCEDGILLLDKVLQL